MSKPSAFVAKVSGKTGPILVFRKSGAGLVAESNGVTWRITAAMVREEGGYREAVKRWAKYRPGVRAALFLETVTF